MDEHGSEKCPPTVLQYKITTDIPVPQNVGNFNTGL